MRHEPHRSRLAAYDPSLLLRQMGSGTIFCGKDESCSMTKQAENSNPLRVHVVGCHRSGTTLMMELLWYAYRFSGRCEHEATLFKPVPPGQTLYLTKKPPDTIRIGRAFLAARVGRNSAAYSAFRVPPTANGARLAVLDWAMVKRAVGWAKAVRPCPHGFNDSRSMTVGDSRSLRVGTLRFAHPTLDVAGVD